MKADLKRAAERKAFERFAAAAGHQIVPGSLAQPDPPAPDISAEIEGAGRVAFELVRLDADDEFLSRRMFLAAQDLLEAEFARLPDPQRDAIAAKFRNSEITVEFRRFADIAARRRALTQVWRVVEGLPAEHDGQVSLRGRSIVDVESIWVIPGDARETPRFRSFIVGSPLPVSADRLTEKLATQYACAEPLELLAYNEIEEYSHYDDEQRIRDAVGAAIAGSQFRRVWVYDKFMHRIVLRFEAP